MAIAESLIAELQQESQTTRRVIERVPDEKLDWRPHPKSMTLGQLAAHIAGLPRGIAELATNLVTEAPTVPLQGDIPVAEMLARIEESVAYATEKLRMWSDDDLRQTWRLTRDGKTLLEIPRIAVIRSVMLNHTYHHRGQLSLYLRLLDVPVPSVYGPTADENVFG